MKICHVINTLTSTSGEATRAIAIDRQTEHDIGLLVWIRGDRNLIPDDIPVHFIQADNDRMAIKESMGVIKNYDVVHHHHPHSGLRSQIAATMLNKPTVYTYGTVPSRYAKKPRIGSLFTTSLANYVTYVSETVMMRMTRVERFLHRPCKVVYPGVDLNLVDNAINYYENYKSDKLLVAAVGRLEPVKNFELLIDCLNGEPDIELIIAGDGSQRNILSGLAGPNVTLLGEQPRELVIKLMYDADVVVIPSKQEGFAGVPLEAMAVGTPVVLSKISAFTIPFKKELAYWTDPNSSNDLRLAIEDAINSDGTREKLARDFVRNTYSVEKTTREYSEIYENIHPYN